MIATDGITGSVNHAIKQRDRTFSAARLALKKL
jgi:hypothetical protein